MYLVHINFALQDQHFLNLHMDLAFKFRGFPKHMFGQVILIMADS